MRPLQVPDASSLDVLPDSSLFILRAVLQLAPAAVEDVAQATRLSPEQVLNAFRFGQSAGILRGATRPGPRDLALASPGDSLLERRHLLVMP